jgi:hypothetical protein
MKKNSIQVNELNKLYDELYYSTLDDVESSLDIITNLISEKEFNEDKSEVVELPDIIDAIIEVLEEVAELFDSEGLIDEYSFTREKIEKIQSGELDDIIEDEYNNYDDEIEDTLMDDDYEDDIDIFENEEEDYGDDYYDGY